MIALSETPDPPDDIRVVEATSRRISLRWNTPFNGNSDILGYFVQWKEVSGELLFLSLAASVLVEQFSGKQAAHSVKNERIVSIRNSVGVAVN